MEYRLDPNSSKPLYVQTEELLREMILEEEYQKGKLLPTELELSQKLNISRNTVRQAIRQLVLDGLLVRKKGHGTKVAALKVMSNARNWKSFSQEMLSMGMKVKDYELHLSYSPAPECAVRFFETNKDLPLFCMERLRGNPNQAFVFFISYFNPAIPISVDEDMSKPLYDILKEKYGVSVKTSTEIISAECASESLSGKLNVNVGDPILVRKRFVRDDKGLPVEYNIGYYRADSFSYYIKFTND